MAGNGDETQAATCYPTTEQYATWKERAAAMDMSVSEFMTYMVEAGWKKFDASVEPDEENAELRHQRNEYKEEVERYRDRVERLENLLLQTERAAIIEYVEENPGATAKEIIAKLGETVGERAAEQLDDLQGIEIEEREGGFYRLEDTE